MQVAALTLSDKPHMGALFEGWKARDGLALTAIAFGGREQLERGPVTYGIANVNSPLTYDARDGRPRSSPTPRPTRRSSSRRSC